MTSQRALVRGALAASSLGSMKHCRDLPIDGQVCEKLFDFLCPHVLGAPSAVELGIQAPVAEERLAHAHCFADGSFTTGRVVIRVVIAIEHDRRSFAY